MLMQGAKVCQDLRRREQPGFELLRRVHAALVAPAPEPDDLRAPTVALERNPR